MKHPERVEDYLDHIVEAITRAESYLELLAGLEDFEKNPQVQDAVIRNIEIIGEAGAEFSSKRPICTSPPRDSLVADARHAE